VSRHVTLTPVVGGCPLALNSAITHYISCCSISSESQGRQLSLYPCFPMKVDRASTSDATARQMKDELTRMEQDDMNIEYSTRATQLSRRISDKVVWRYTPRVTSTFGM
jgi:hypothetical protein